MTYEFEPDSIRTSDSQDSGGDVRCALRLPLNAAPLGLPYGLARVVYLDASRCVMRPPSSVGRRCGGCVLVVLRRARGQPRRVT